MTAIGDATARPTSLLDASRGGPSLRADADAALAGSDDPVARGFSAMLMRQVVQAMRRTVPSSEGPGGQVYDHLMETALADFLARSDRLGLEESLHLEAGRPDPSPATDPTPAGSLEALLFAAPGPTGSADD